MSPFYVQYPQRIRSLQQSKYSAGKTKKKILVHKSLNMNTYTSQEATQGYSQSTVSADVRNT